MSDQSNIPENPVDEAHDSSLAEVSARRLAARTQWQMALARAKERFAPANVATEIIDRTADTIGGAADKSASLAWAHRGKIALAALLGGLFVARKPIAKNAGPLAARAKVSLNDAADAIKNLKKR